MWSLGAVAATSEAAPVMSATCDRRSGVTRADGLRHRRARGFSWSGRRASDRSLGFSPPFCTARRAVRFDGRTVDHDEPRRTATSYERCQNPLPQPALAPSVVPIKNRRIWPVFVGQSPPPATLAQTVDDSGDDTAIILALRTGVDRRQMRRDHRPLFVNKPKVVSHDPSPPRKLESQFAN